MPVHGPCECECGREGELRLGRWADACYQRWINHGRPETGPPPAQSPDPAAALAASHANARARSAATTARVGALRDAGLSLGAIAVRVGLTRRVVAKHAARHKQQQKETS